jgi:hypothetical protein
MARVISFDDLNGSNTEYVAPELRIVSPDDPPIFVGDENGSGGGFIDITPHAIHPPVFNKDAPPDEVLILGDTLPVGSGVPATNTNKGGGVLMTMTGAQANSTQGGIASAPVADLTAKIQTLATEQPLLVFGAIGLGLYLLLKDKK